MPKGRCCNPSTQRDGIWFRHPDPDELETITMQTTVSMLKQAELLKAQDPEWKAPLKFLAKPQKNTKPEFPFSSHDNRHAMQTSVEYFDAGLGRKKVEKDKGQHVSQNFVLWSHGTPPKATSYLDGYTNYQTSYTSLQGVCTSERAFCGRYAKCHMAKSLSVQTIPEKSDLCHLDPSMQGKIPPRTESITQPPTSNSSKSTSVEML
ncbi:testis-expressed protein 36 [Pleurodeles waltl]|uniref:testis-expressed protein 36 n=1 Tax=Pleurodeles waltl TaxID=8319 RepID=UPI0037095125